MPRKVRKLNIIKENNCKIFRNILILFLLTYCMHHVWGLCVVCTSHSAYVDVRRLIAGVSSFLVS